jgi:hypothetical protein
MLESRVLLEVTNGKLEILTSQRGADRHLRLEVRMGIVPLAILRMASNLNTQRN